MLSGCRTHLLRGVISTIAILLLALIVGCGKQESETPNSEKPASKKAASDGALEPQTFAKTGPGADEQNCFECNAKGTVNCKAQGCVKGMAECPGPCVRLTKGKWERMTVAGHDPSELWQKIRVANGWQAYSQGHVGEVITVVNGAMVNQGRCQVCGGTTRVDCRTCKKTGTQPCEICEGKKFIPTSWTATNNPWFNRQPDVIRLRDGRVLLGKVAANTGDEAIIRARDGSITRVKRADILPAR